MAGLRCVLLLVVTVVGRSICCPRCLNLKIISDFKSPEDLKLIQSLPNIIDKVGEDIKLNFFFLDEVRKNGPRMCVLEELRDNGYLLTDYLKCEADGKTSEECRDKLPINANTFTSCLRKDPTRFTKEAKKEFKLAQADKTPVVLLPNRKKLNIDNLLKEICDNFRFDKPEGCKEEPKPTPEPTLPPTSESTSETTSESTSTTESTGST